MNLFLLVSRYLFAKPLNTALNILLLALGLGMITILIIAGRQLEEKISSNTQGVDLVVGAKGSPLQIILCNIFHIDFPTGNIPLFEAEKISTHRLVKKAIPLALGDSYQGYRIIGTTSEYALHYNIQVASGTWAARPMEVTLGAGVAQKLNLGIGDRFESNHGLNAEGHAHEEQAFVVTGVAAKAGSIVDDLIFTSIESVWLVHEAHGASEAGSVDSLERSSLVPSVSLHDSTREITSMLLQYRSPMAAIQLPRLINSRTSMQAASPAFESARLFTILGAGIEAITSFAYLLVVISALSIFLALYNALRERKYDMAILRTMGASPLKLLSLVIAEGVLLTFLGALLGLLLAHVAVEVMVMSSEDAARTGMTGYVFYSEESGIFAVSLLVGIFCSLVPAVQAYRTDISRVLAGN